MFYLQILIFRSRFYLCKIEIVAEIKKLFQITQCLKLMLIFCVFPGIKSIKSINPLKFKKRFKVRRRAKR